MYTCTVQRLWECELSVGTAVAFCRCIHFPGVLFLSLLVSTNYFFSFTLHDFYLVL